MPTEKRYLIYLYDDYNLARCLKLYSEDDIILLNSKHDLVSERRGLFLLMIITLTLLLNKPVITKPKID